MDMLARTQFAYEYEIKHVSDWTEFTVRSHYSCDAAFISQRCKR